MKAEILLAVETANVGLMNSLAPVKLLLKCIVDSKIEENGRDSSDLLAALSKSASKFFNI